MSRVDVSFLNTPPLSVITFTTPLGTAILLHDILNIIDAAYHSPLSTLALPNAWVVGV